MIMMTRSAGWGSSDDFDLFHDNIDDDDDCDEAADAADADDADKDLQDGAARMVADDNGRHNDIQFDECEDDDGDDCEDKRQQ